MNRLFWLIAGMILGAVGYRYYREQGGSWETLSESGREMLETAKSQASRLTGADVEHMAGTVQQAAGDMTASVRQHAQAVAEEGKRSAAATAEQAKSHAEAVKDDAKRTT